MSNPYLDQTGQYRPLSMSDAALASPAYAAARRSWAASNAGDRDAWIAGWSPEGCIEDPVGPSMFDPEGIGHRGTERLLEFWEKAVATPDHIEFRFDRGIAAGDELLCTGTMRTHMGENIMEIDIAVNYRVDSNGRLVALRAFWEQDVAMATGLRPLTDDDRAAVAGAARKGQ